MLMGSWFWGDWERDGHERDEGRRGRDAGDGKASGSEAKVGKYRRRGWQEARGRSGRCGERHRRDIMGPLYLLVLKSVVENNDHAKSGGDRLCHFQTGGGVVA